MKTQIIKIIPCLLAGFILSACVGVINVPSSVVDKAVKTTEPDPVIKKNTTVIVDDKEPEPEPKTQEVIETVEPQDKNVVKTVEPKTEEGVIPPNPCLANPFGDTCTADFNVARELVCASEPNSNRCTPTITRVCGADVLDTLCTGKAKYFTAQYAACEGEPNSERCKATYARVCGDVFRDAPFLLYCADSEAHHPARYRVCISAYWQNKCKATVARVCGADSLDVICARLATYYPAQKAACEGEPNSERCTATYARICGADAFLLYCADSEAYHPVRYAACKGEIGSYRCEPTIARVCGADSLDVICRSLATYYPAQKTACEGEPNSERCAPTRARVCPDTPFATACQENNLTRYDFDEVSGATTYIWNGTRGGVCNRWAEGEGYCDARIPYYDADIKPLNDTNTGTATYTGDLTIAYHNNDYSDEQIAAPNYKYEYAKQTTNINIVVNFGDNSLSYSGMIAANAFSINGSFTDRGLITGTANFRDTEAGLGGLIGQTEMIGGFATGRNAKAFAGGFTATRE